MLPMLASGRVCLTFCIHWKGEYISLLDIALLVYLEVTLYFIFMFRGQVLPAESLLNSVNVDLIYEGVKYCLKVLP